MCKLIGKNAITMNKLEFSSSFFFVETQIQKSRTQIRIAVPKQQICKSVDKMQSLKHKRKQ